jgi:hypothetical protein
MVLIEARGISRIYKTGTVEVAALRDVEHLGFVFQEFNLVPVLSACENVEYPLLVAHNWPPEKRRAQVMELPGAVGMAEQADKRPGELRTRRQGQARDLHRLRPHQRQRGHRPLPDGQHRRGARGGRAREPGRGPVVRPRQAGAALGQGLRVEPGGLL